MVKSGKVAVIFMLGSLSHYSNIQDAIKVMHFLLSVHHSKKCSFYLQNENLANGDVLQGLFVDSYRNLTLKTLNILTWYVKKCDRIPFLLKTDDDMYINTENLYKFASKLVVEDLKGEGWITGFLHENAKPFRDPDHKYYVPEQLYPGKVYPNFVTGTCYLVSRKTFSTSWCRNQMDKFR